MKSTLSLHLFNMAYNDLVQMSKKNLTKSQPCEFYENTMKFIVHTTECFVSTYKETIERSIEPQDFTTLIHFLQQIVLNLTTLRYFYHIDQEIIDQNEKVKRLWQRAHLIDVAKRVIPADGIERHAEVNLIDATIDETDVFFMDLHGSKKLCLQCHALIQIYNEFDTNPYIDFDGVHNISFEDGWAKPMHIAKIYQKCGGQNKYIKKFAEITKEKKAQVFMISNSGYIEKKRVSMFHTPLVLKKALNII